MDDESNVTRLGWHVRDWCQQVGICTATFYNLELEQQPRSVRLRQRRLVIEHPKDYLNRVAEIQHSKAA